MSTMYEATSTTDGLGNVDPDDAPGVEPLVKSSPATAAAVGGVEVVSTLNREGTRDRHKQPWSRSTQGLRRREEEPEEKSCLLWLKNYGLTFSHVDLHRADSIPPKLGYERPLRPMSRTHSPFYLLWQTLLRLMNQANPNSDGPAANSARLSTTHTISSLIT